MKAAVIKIVLASGIYLLLPVGPLWYLWYGQRPGIENEADVLTIISVSILLLGLSILFVMAGHSLFVQLKRKEDKQKPSSEEVGG